MYLCSHACFLNVLRGKVSPKTFGSLDLSIDDLQRIDSLGVRTGPTDHELRSRYSGETFDVTWLINRGHYITHLGGIKPDADLWAIFRDFPYCHALFGLVSYNDP